MASFTKLRHDHMSGNDEWDFCRACAIEFFLWKDNR
jgi:hypothetical protein